MTRIELGGGAIAYFFAGSISANAGGYNRGWGILVAKDGCAWKRVGGGFTSDPMKELRAPSGAHVLVQTHDGDGSLYECPGGETRLFLVQSANEFHDLRIPASPEKSSCRGAPRAELKIEEGTLTGVRILSSSADTPEGEEKWNDAGYVVFENGKYILHRASR